MEITDKDNEVEEVAKPHFRHLQEGKDFQILGEALGHTTFSIMDEDAEQIFMCKGTDLILNSITFQKGMILEKHTTRLPTHLVVQKGEVIYKTDLRELRLKQRDQHPIPIDEPHWVEAVHDSVIILLKNRTF